MRPVFLLTCLFMAPRKADLRASAYRSANDCLVPIGVSTPAAGDRLQPLHSCTAAVGHFNFNVTGFDGSRRCGGSSM